MSHRLGTFSPKESKSEFNSYRPCMDKWNISWFAISAAALMSIAVVSSVIGVTEESWWLLAHGGVLALIAIASAILSLKE